MFRITGLILFAIALCSCATEKQPEILETGVEKAPPLAPMEQMLFDVNTGDAIGKVKYINDEATFVILLETEKTEVKKEIYNEVTEKMEIRRIQQEPYIGSFSGKNRSVMDDTYFVYGTSSVDKLYIVVHDDNVMFKTIFKKRKPKGEHIYLVSVMDHPTFMKVMKRSADAFDPIKNLSEVKDKMRTQALIKIEKGKS